MKTDFIFHNEGTLIMLLPQTDQAAADAEYNDFIKNSLQRYIRCDWGDLCDEDKQLNDDAITEGENAGRVLSRYNNAKGDIYIITEADRSATTILHPSDY